MSKHYSNSHYASVDRAESEHFWFVARNEMLRRLIQRYVPQFRGNRVLDVGCGTGLMLRTLGKLGYSMTGLDINARALSYASRKTDAALVRSTIFRYTPAEKYSAVGAFDVMEHIRDDTAFMKKCRALLRRNGYMFLTVPAGQDLWSAADDASGHLRRYTKSGLNSLIHRAGFRLVHLGYWNSLLLPVYILWRSMGASRDADELQDYLRTPHPVVNRFCLFILRMERYILPGRIPFGATLVAVAQKV